MDDDRRSTRTINYANPAAGAVYGLGWIGALVYFLQHASGFWPIVLAILKSFVWPSFLVYKLLELFRL